MSALNCKRKHVECVYTMQGKQQQQQQNKKPVTIKMGTNTTGMVYHPVLRRTTSSPTKARTRMINTSDRQIWQIADERIWARSSSFLLIDIISLACTRSRMSDAKIPTNKGIATNAQFQLQIIERNFSLKKKKTLQAPGDPFRSEAHKNDQRSPEDPPPQHKQSKAESLPSSLHLRRTSISKKKKKSYSRTGVGGASSLGSWLAGGPQCLRILPIMDSRLKNSQTNKGIHT